jgi:uncharacterized protein (TIGR02246 family)
MKHTVTNYARTVNAFLRLPALVVLVLMGVGCAGSPSSTYVSPEIDAPEAIATEWSNYRTAMLAGDTDTFVGLHTDDILMTLQDLPPMSGRTELRGFMGHVFETAEVVAFDVATEEVTVHGTSAYELGRFAEEVRFSKEKTLQKEGRYLCIWVHQPDGRWRIRNLVELEEAAPPL